MNFHPPTTEDCDNRHLGLRLQLMSVLLSLMFLVTASSAQEIVDKTAEYNVKGVYVYNFGRYITWPAETNTPPGEFVVGVVGHSPVSVPLDKLAKLKKITDRRTNEDLELKVISINSIDDYIPCHILFIPAVTDPEIATYLIENFRNKPVFLIGESADFSKNGGSAGLHISTGSVRFDINITDAQNKGLIIDAKLLKAANKIVENDARNVSIQP